MRTSESIVKWLNYMTIGEVNLLKELVASLPERPIVVNIGAGGGTSGLAIMETRPDVRLVTCDIQKESSPFGCLDAEAQMLHEAGLCDWNRYTQLHGDSKEFGKNWSGEKVDLVFVDGDHSRDGVRGDILNWLPNLKENGIIAFHDYKKPPMNRPDYKGYDPTLIEAWTPPWPEVDLAVDEMIESYCKRIGRIDMMVAFKVYDGNMVLEALELGIKELVPLTWEYKLDELTENTQIWSIPLTETSNSTEENPEYAMPMTLIKPNENDIPVEALTELVIEAKKTEPSEDWEAELDVLVPDNVCPNCEREFKSARGVKIHSRSCK